jgi:hypothetical protein
MASTDVFYNFNAEWFDVQASLVRPFQIRYFEDNTVELVSHHRNIYSNKNA